MVLVELLLAQGAAPAHVAGDGTTPLHWARENGHTDITARLEAAGAGE